MLISSYNGNNVRIHDACDGSFIRNLDTNGTLAGPQAIALDPAGNLVVASETNGRLVRYHRSTLTYDAVISGDRPETPQVEPVQAASPTGLAIAPDGRMFAGSYTQQRVVEIDPDTGLALGDIATMARSGVEGPDTGMLLDGNRLLVPGFDSDSVIEADISQAASDRVLVAAGAGGLNAPRTVLKLPGGNLLVTSWRGNAILEFNGASGAFERTVSTAVERPTGMALESDGVLLVASDRDHNIRRIDLDSGRVVGTPVGFVDAPTFILLLDKENTNLAQNNAFWVIGVGAIEGKTISADEMVLTTGGQFGAAFDPASIENQPWGRLEVEFGSCDGGEVSWVPTDPAFEAGGYAIVRLATDAFSVECNETGFETIDHDRWMNGLWYGGPARDGEGFSVNIIEGGLAVITWYTYRP